MGKPSLSKIEIDQIVDLRKNGHTLSEIQAVVKRAYGTVFKYMKNVSVLPEKEEFWKVRRGGSKFRSLSEWQEAKVKAKNLIFPIGKKERLIILACLYWGEGNKSELNLINSDPDLIRLFVSCLRDIGVTKDQLKVSIRIYDDVNKKEAIRFWAGVVGISPDEILSVNVLFGKKKGKLKYGMCRVRVQKGKLYFKLIMSMIALMKENLLLP
ncbi:MAG: hypothetical protein V4467_03760 [Patescibacteria group bacterium]